jgi:aminoglycoside phosphotransferase (APT) family kinase protein
VYASSPTKASVVFDRVTMDGNQSEILDLLRRDHLLSEGEVRITALAGGVSSDVFLIEQGSRRFVLKRALPRLRVEDEWRANISRNGIEYEFLRYVQSIIPDAVPSVFAKGDGYFTMEYLGAEYKNWKQVLLSGECPGEHALQAAHILGTLHRISFGNPELAKSFETTANFHQLRTDPYLLTTGRRHPDLQSIFVNEAARLEQTRECLVHGDFSPKNLLIGNGRMVLLDCEVAWYGDPAFDLGFLINHLLLKSLYLAPWDCGLKASIESLLDVYFQRRELSESARGELEARTARLLLMLMLARIDGKSPVEYLTDDLRRNFVRGFVTDRLRFFALDLGQLIAEWFRDLQNHRWPTRSK